MCLILPEHIFHGIVEREEYLLVAYFGLSIHAVPCRASWIRRAFTYFRDARSPSLLPIPCSMIKLDAPS